MTKNLAASLGFILCSSVSMANTVQCGIVRMTNQDTKRVVDVTLDCSTEQAQISTSVIGTLSFACENTGSEIKVQVANVKDGNSISTGNSLSATRKSFSSYYLTLDQSLAIHCTLK